MADDEGAPAAPAAAAAAAASDVAAHVPEEEAPAPAFKSRSSSRGGNIRRRKAAAAAVDSEEEDKGVAVAKKARQEAQGLRIAGGSSKKPGGDDGNGDDEQPATTVATGARFVSDRKLQESGDALATATLETETEFDRDARAIRAAVLTNALGDQTKRNDGPSDEQKGDSTSIYTGARNYSDHNAGFRRHLDAATAAAGGGKAAGSHGPLRASVHARMSVRFDYQPDICKDYKETGYCGFGDACKFLHDRGDHKSGWQIDKEWEAKQQKEAEDRKRREAGIFDDEEGRAGGEGNDEDGLPFACLGCKRPWAAGGEGERRDEVASDPVVTRCGHHFCEACALRNASSDPKCPVCGKPHGGTFNVAREIVRKLGRGKRGAL